jgi:RNA recognition motif-containing protein
LHWTEFKALKLNGTKMTETPVVVNRSYEKPPKKKKAKMSRNEQHDDTRTIYVGNLPFNIAPRTVKRFFLKYGNVSRVEIPKLRVNGKSRGFAIVEFETVESRNAAFDADGATVGGTNHRP